MNGDSPTSKPYFFSGSSSGSCASSFGVCCVFEKVICYKKILRDAFQKKNVRMEGH